MSFELIDNKDQKANIKVVGVGGCGNNAIEYMIKNKVEGVEFICINTDAQDLKYNPVSDNNKFNIGQNITRGLGAGANPDVGRQAAIEDRDKLKDVIGNCDMLFITAGMGGGTGTGASTVIAEIARELGILTVAVVTKPWAFEGKKRMSNAKEGIEELRGKVDSLIIIPNDKLLNDDEMPLTEQKNQSNAVLERAVRGIAELITKPGEINLDFADVKSVMSCAGSTMMGSGMGLGVDRAEDAVMQAIASPLLESVDIKNAKQLLINISSNGSLTTGEIKIIGGHIGSLLDSEDPNANVILGTTIDESLESSIKVTVVATGMDNNIGLEAKKSIKEIKVDPYYKLKNFKEKIISVNELEKTKTIQEKFEFDDKQADYEFFIEEPIEVNNDLSNYDKQYEYAKNIQTGEKERKHIVKGKKSEEKNNINEAIDYDYLDIPAFLRKQAD